MPANPNVRFGRSIKPLSPKDVQKGGVQKIYGKNATKARSPNITVGVEPVVLVAFGLKSGELVRVYNVFENLEVPLVVNAVDVVLSDTNTIVILPVAGVYALEFDGPELGDLLVIAYQLSAMDEKALKSVNLSNPNGPQKAKPNLFLDGSFGILETKVFTVGTIPFVFRAYELGDVVLQLYAVFDEYEVPVYENGLVTIAGPETTLIVSISGQYKFKVVGESDGVILVANPTVLNQYGTADSSNPTPGDGVTFVGTGAGLTGGPITGSGTIALNTDSQAKLALADSALQPGDNVGELVNNVGYIDDDDIIDGGNF